jgi:hypothetical protein
MADKKAFIPEGERPEVRIDPEMSLTDLKVRDLSAILGQIDFKSIRKEIKIEKLEKPEKFEKIEKWERIEKPDKFEKFEKIEKPEKFEKIERIEVVKREPEIPKPGDPVIDDPFRDPRVFEGINQLVESISQLTGQVQDLANRVTKLGG